MKLQHYRTDSFREVFGDLFYRVIWVAKCGPDLTEIYFEGKWSKVKESPCKVYIVCLFRQKGQNKEFTLKSHESHNFLGIGKEGSVSLLSL